MRRTAVLPVLLLLLLLCSSWQACSQDTANVQVERVDGDEDVAGPVVKVVKVKDLSGRPHKDKPGAAKGKVHRTSTVRLANEAAPADAPGISANATANLTSTTPPPEEKPETLAQILDHALQKEFTKETAADAVLNGAQFNETARTDEVSGGGEGVFWGAAGRRRVDPTCDTGGIIKPGGAAC